MSRIAILNKEKCKGAECGYICMKVCPRNRSGDECIVTEEDKKPLIDEELCIGCSICVKQCPFEAIKIVNLPEELKKEPIHRYGKNQFALYSLPIPIFNRVVGVLGMNGIGKTTAIKIIANAIKPNLGKEKEASYEELIEYFKGTEMQSFFEKLKGNKIKVSYKPQQVDLIPKTSKGNVIELLRKVDEKNKLEEVAKELEIDNILNSDIENISGGELQRVAIAATVLKKANLYIFDELTSYLDIKQRLKIANFIRALADEETAVLVIEHDLIALDYMADIMHIMYGKEGCYGVVSLPKATKAGINSYLEGYSKEENVRFRDHKIKFEAKPPAGSKKENILTEWDGLRKDLGPFKLESEQGNINKNEVVGILGENGIGKTTFVKILAGVLKPDVGEFDKKIKVSYKPQYIGTSDDIVIDVLQKAIKEHKNDIIAPLKIEPLLNQKISELSGGELQRVAIALCLSNDCDLALLDEPSAYLDVEQRLVVSKIIANIAKTKDIAVIVVEHDLLFLDYLSERLMPFKGIPAKHGIATGPYPMEQGMNELLKKLNITLRRDGLSHRPRINKVGSVKDREQKSKEKFYYT